MGLPSAPDEPAIRNLSEVLGCKFHTLHQGLAGPGIKPSDLIAKEVTSDEGELLGIAVNTIDERDKIQGVDKA